MPSSVLVKLSRFMGLALLALVAVCLGADQTAPELFKEAQKAERSGQTVRAYLLYSQAAAKDPTNAVYWTKAQALRPAASMARPEIGAAIEPKSDTPEIDPTLVGSISEWDIVEAKRHPLPPTELKADPGTKDFQLKGDAKSLWEQVAKAYNLLVVFDTGYQPLSNIRVDINEADYREAIRILEGATNSFVVPVADRLILVASDTPQKRQELESSASVVIPIPDPVTVQEIQEIGTAIRGTLEIQRLMIDTQRKMVLIRDRVWKVRAAQLLLKDLMRPKPQVAIEIEVLSVDKTSNATWGIEFPTEFPLVPLGNFIRAWPKNLSSSIPAGFTRFLTFGGGATFMGLGLTNATIFATASKANASTLLKSEVVTSDGTAVSFHVGEKYPIVTGSYQFSTTSQNAFVPPPQFNFEDLGLILKITPHAHGTEEVSLEVSAEFKLLGAASFNDIPVIASRKLESKVRLLNGEWAVLAGLVTKTEMKTITGIPGLSFIPFLRKNTTQDDRSDTMIVLKPHLLNLPPTEGSTHTGWIGSETRPRSL